MMVVYLQQHTNSPCWISWRTSSTMKLFTRKNKPFSMVLGLVLISMLLAACGSSAGTGTGSSSSNGSSGSGSSASGANGKGCTKVGVLLPETASSARWEANDHPLLVDGLKAAGFTTVDYNNAQG